MYRLFETQLESSAILRAVQVDSAVPQAVGTFTKDSSSLTTYGE